MTLALGSVNAAAFSAIDPRRWTEAAAVYNMFRNLGASLGLCLASVFQERAAQARLARLTEAHLDVLDRTVVERLGEVAGRLLPGPAAGDPAAADLLALRWLDGLRQDQAQALAHLDALLACGVLAAALIPLVLPIGRRAPGGVPGDRRDPCG